MNLDARAARQVAVLRNHWLPLVLLVGMACVCVGCGGGSDVEGVEGGACAVDGAAGSTPKVLEGSFTLSDSAGLETLQGVTEVAGTLEVKAPELTSVCLPELTSVGGDLSVTGNDVMTSLSLPGLTSVGGYLEVNHNASLTSFELPALAGSGGNLQVYDNTTLTMFSLPALASIGGSFGVTDNAALTSFPAPRLTSVNGWFRVHDNAALPQCLVDALVEQVRAAEGIGGETTTRLNNTCVCEEVGGVLEATCP